MPPGSPPRTDASVAVRTAVRVCPFLERTATFRRVLALIASWPGPGSFTVSRITPPRVTLTETIVKPLLTELAAAEAAAGPDVLGLTTVSDKPPLPVGIPTITDVPPAAVLGTVDGLDGRQLTVADEM